MRRLILAAATVALAAACGGDDDAATETTTAATTEATPTSTTTATTAAAAANDEEGTVAAEGDLVAVHYVGTLDSGEEFDASRPRGSTLDFTVGAGQMIAGFDEAVRGMAAGEIKTVRLSPADAYGEVSEDLIVEFPASQAPEGVGAGDTVVLSDGRQAQVLELNDEVIRIDANHPLAGEFLTFEIEMVAINP